MFNPDQPIQSRDEDSLGRWPFAKSLGEALLSYKDTESVAIGLYGSWGTGKTSVLNLVKKYIEEKFADPEPRQKPVVTYFKQWVRKILRRGPAGEPGRKPFVIDFNPWHYSDQNQLITLFFKDLSTAMKCIPSYERGRQIQGLVDDMYLHFLCLSILTSGKPSIAAVTLAASKGFRILSRMIKDWVLKRERDLDELKRALDQELLLKQSKIIIFIDDIDRLNSTEIRQTFQLVKSLADFKNTIYVLAFDKKVVMDALDDVQKAPGQLYLEKIISVSFDIVSAGKSEIRRELHDRLKEIVANGWDEKLWDSLYEHQLRHFFSTLRDVTRFLNTFGFSYGLLRDDVRFEDLAVITAIQVHEPVVYSEIHKNKRLFAGEYRPLLRSIMTKEEDERLHREEVKRQYDEIFERSVKVPPHELREILLITFPKIDAVYSSNTTEWDRDSDWRRSKRICSREYFNRYFKLVLSEDEFSQNEIDSILCKTADVQQFLGELQRLKDENRLDAFLDTLQFLDRNKLSDQQISIVMTALLHIDDIFSTAQPDKLGWAVAGQMSSIVSEYFTDLRFP